MSGWRRETDKFVFAGGIAINNESGEGIRLGKYTNRGSASYGWRDITHPIEVRGVRAVDPVWAEIGATGFFGYQFALDKEVHGTAHVPHDIVPGTAVHFHVHWLPDGTDTNPVTWEFTYAYAKGFNQEAFDFALANSPNTTAGVATATEAGPGVQYQHMVTETAAVTIPGLTEPDGLIHYRIKRISSTPETDNTDNIYVLTTDIHYQSTNMATKQRTPDFYGD